MWTARLNRWARLFDTYTLWAFNPQPPLDYRRRADGWR
jgi:hypothetical protein